MAVEKKLVRSKSGLRIIASNDNNRSPFELVEPPWIPDCECRNCTECNAKFDFMKRRHHCRRCGKIYCSNCCEVKLQLPRFCFVDPVRVCGSCADVTRKENDFYDNKLKILITGANFLVSSSENPMENESSSFLCKLSSDHRYIVFDGGNLAQHEPIDLVRIQSVQIIKSTDEHQGNFVANGLLVKYLDPQKLNQDLRLVASTIPNKKMSMLWIVALQKAIKMMFESNGTPCD